MVTGVAYGLERKAPVRRLDDGDSNEALFDPMKCFKTLISKNKRGIFPKAK